MIRKSFLICCVAILLAAVCINSVSVSMAEKQAEEFDTALALANSADKTATAFSVLYKRAGDVVLALPYASINLSQTALMKVYSGEQNDAIRYLNTHADEELANAFAAMDAIIADFDKALSKYNVPSGSSYRSKRSKLVSTFNGLETAATELIRRTRTLIAGTDSGYDSYYTAYCEQLQKLSEKLQAAAELIDEEYDAIMSSLLGSDYSIVS